MAHKAWGKHHVKELLRLTAPPGEILNKNGHTLDDRELFIDTLTLAITLKDKGKLLLSELRKKWPAEVESPMAEAEKIAAQLNMAKSEKILFGPGYQHDSNKSPEENWEAMREYYAKKGHDIGEMPDDLELDDPDLIKIVENLK